MNLSESSIEKLSRKINESFEAYDNPDLKEKIKDQISELMYDYVDPTDVYLRWKWPTEKLIEDHGKLPVVEPRVFRPRPALNRLRERIRDFIRNLNIRDLPRNKAAQWIAGLSVIAFLIIVIIILIGRGDQPNQIATDPTSAPQVVPPVDTFTPRPTSTITPIPPPTNTPTITNSPTETKTPTITSTPTDTQTPTPAPIILFEDNFDSGVLAKDWVIDTWNPYAIGGVLHIDDTTTMSVGDVSWTDYEVKFTVTNPVCAAYGPWVSVRAKDSGNRMEFGFCLNELIWSEVTDNIPFVIQGSRVRINQQTLDIDIKVKGDSFQDDSYDPYHTSKFPNGKIYIHLLPASTIDNFQVIKLP